MLPFHGRLCLQMVRGVPSLRSERLFPLRRIWEGGCMPLVFRPFHLWSVGHSPMLPLSHEGWMSDTSCACRSSFGWGGELHHWIGTTLCGKNFSWVGVEIDPVAGVRRNSSPAPLRVMAFIRENSKFRGERFHVGWGMASPIPVPVWIEGDTRGGWTGTILDDIGILFTPFRGHDTPKHCGSFACRRRGDHGVEIRPVSSGLDSFHTLCWTCHRSIRL